ncbi:hypothetical protein [Borrelia hermsii]|uniref:Lipoprotein n=2 Tax=Borrelia hermsii TaxID=140 RepID=S4VN21_BORHE|nr:hypothetical protein [Borrelia hermsii]AGO68815.1 hypothetical protein BHA045 [Borrelia hermsii]AMR75881.1 hypothetical protein A0V01_04525 [Borrelia hermsii]ANA43687.1 putative lipoprotein [Borrelia hermsii HS1]UCP01914.1 hypothetical protein K9R62_04575 [Borrelia hermsii]UPA08481.1 hypothetical protein bhDAH_001189 [Borrelia hermsii DAH]
MKKISMLICLFGTLGLMLGCFAGGKVPGGNASGSHRFTGDIGAPSTPPPPRARYPQVVASYDALNTSLSALKASYSYNRDVFLPIKDQFKSSIFNEFKMDFNDDRARGDVYVSLKHEVADITNLKTVVDALTSSNASQSDKVFALCLLYRLRASAMYIREIVDENEGILSQANLDVLRHSNDLRGMNLLKADLDEMLSLRNIVVDMAKGMLKEAVRVVGDNAKVLLVLNLITSAQGDLKENINSATKRSLRDLRTKIESTFNNLRLQVLRSE